MNPRGWRSALSRAFFPSRRGRWRRKMCGNSRRSLFSAKCLHPGPRWEAAVCAASVLPSELRVTHRSTCKRHAAMTSRWRELLAVSWTVWPEGTSGNSLPLIHSRVYFFISQIMRPWSEPFKKTKKNLMSQMRYITCGYYYFDISQNLLPEHWFTSNKTRGL